jgi:hypothetical protein
VKPEELGAKYNELAETYKKQRETIQEIEERFTAKFYDILCDETADFFNKRMIEEGFGDLVLKIVRSDVVDGPHGTDLADLISGKGMASLMQAHIQHREGTA